MLSDSLVVTTLVVTELDLAKRFYQEQLGLKLLDENPFSFRLAPARGRS